MQKSLYTILYIFITFLGLRAQPQTVLNANNTAAPIAANGSLFSGGLEIPKGLLTKSIANAQFWIGGKNNGVLHIAAQLNDSIYKPDFWAGPLDTLTAKASDTTVWNTIFKVKAQEIVFHQQNYNKQGYVMPNSIKNWPGSSTTTQNVAKILAPFVDFNENKKYEPQLGEYPFIKGDEAAYFICNDNANTHYTTGGLPLGVEVQGMAYQFAGKPDVENTVFLQLSFINRSANNYDSVFAGIWADFALGNPTDNFISTLPSKNAFLVYNADTLDEGTNGYGKNPPAQAIVFLNRPLQYTIEIANTTGQRGLPQNPLHFYNYLKRTWKDNSALTDGFNGYLSGSSTNFIYNGNPCDAVNPGWTEIGAALLPGKRSMIGSVGPLNLPTKGFIRLDVAFVWARSSGGPFESVCSLNTAIDRVTSFYKNTLSTPHSTENTMAVSLYPNPARTRLQVAVNDALTDNFSMEIIDLQGKTVLQQVFTTNKSEVDIQLLPSGVYIVRVTTNNSFAIKKLVIAP